MSESKAPPADDCWWRFARVMAIVVSGGVKMSDIMLGLLWFGCWAAMIFLAVH